MLIVLSTYARVVSADAADRVLETSVAGCKGKKEKPAIKIVGFSGTGELF
jgi:hypothetical protein